MKNKTGKPQVQVLAEAVALRVQAKLLNEEADSLMDSIGLTPSGYPKKTAKKNKTKSITKKAA
jgi:hypothetical protein